MRFGDQSITLSFMTKRVFIFTACLLFIASQAQAAKEPLLNSEKVDVKAAKITSAKDELVDDKEEALVPKEVAEDTNKDGKPDRWQYYSGGAIARAEVDGNFDGKVDEIAFFQKGKIAKVEKDSDFDGKMDKWVSY